MQSKQDSLLEIGYTRSQWEDKDDPTSEANDLLFIEYTKPINEHFKIEITFSYRLHEAPDIYKCFEESVELCGGGEFLQLETSIEAAEQVYRLLSTKTK